MRSLWRGSVRVGKVMFPASLVKASEHEDPSFRSLHRECGHPLAQLRHCPACDRILEAGLSESVRGFEISDNQFVTIENDELDKALGAKRLDLTRFIELDDVPWTALSTSYWLLPPDDEYARRAYALLRDALAEGERGGLGRFSHYTKERVLLVRQSGGLLAAHALFTGKEIRDVRKLDGDLQKIASVAGERELMLQAIEERAWPFKVSQLDRRYPKRLLKVIAQKARTGQVVEVPDAAATTLDLTDALKASVQTKTPARSAR